MAKVNVYGIDGAVKETVDLPPVFDTPYRPDIIRKSFNVLHSNKRQPYGADPLAGTKHATASVGKGRGQRRAHPPKAEKIWKEKMNKKEKLLAKNSALAATKEKGIVTKRGHAFDETVTLPVVVDDEFEKIKKTKDIITALEKIGIYDDVLRSTNGKHIRAGRGKSRGRRYRIPKSLLIVSTKDTLEKSSNNLSGVDITKPDQLNIEYLAPGGDPGRLTIFTKSALQQLGGSK
jgi:large subunit ribosomal protein L4e